MIARVRPGDDPLAWCLEAAAEGDNAAFGEMVRATQAAVWRVCSALGTRGEEEDLVQETYLRAMRSMPAFRREAPVSIWLLSIARRVCADDVRRRQRRRRLAARLTDDVRELSVSAHEMIADLIDGLDDDRRSAFLLTQYVGLTYEEAAAVLECPVGTIRSRVSRARGDLASAIARAEAQ